MNWVRFDAWLLICTGKCVRLGLSFFVCDIAATHLIHCQVLIIYLFSLLWRWSTRTRQFKTKLLKIKTFSLKLLVCVAAVETAMTRNKLQSTPLWDVIMFFLERQHWLKLWITWWAEQRHRDATGVRLLSCSTSFATYKNCSSCCRRGE